MKALTPQVVRPLVLQHLSKNASGQVWSVVTGIVELAVGRGLLDHQAAHNLGQYERGVLFDRVQMIMWQLLPQGVLVWGLGGENNDEYPFYRLTEHGKAVVSGSASTPQPYDPDGFLSEFRRLVPNADPVALEYLQESVRAFNAACYKSAAVMLGAASEKLTLLLHEQFERSIADAERKAAFVKASQGISVFRKFQALKDGLDRMDGAKAFKEHHDLQGTIRHDLPAVAELIRRCRNDAGHPEIPTQTDPDTVFLSLRVFAEHARKVDELLRFLEANPAEW